MEARSTALPGVRIATSDSTGIFRFPLLPPGVYAVSAALPGFQTVRQGELRVSLGEATRIALTLTLSAEAQVAVSGRAPLIDVSSTTLGGSLTSSAISELPLARNYVSVASIFAGTIPDSAGLTVYGATGLENHYVIDGLNTTGVRFGGQGKLLNTEFVQEVEVRTGGYEAEFGQVLGGNINVITKSGSNEFHGDVFGYYDSSSLAAADQHAADRSAVAFAQPAVPRRLDAGFGIGGFVLKDRLWFFGAFDHVKNDQDIDRVESLTYPPGGLAPASNLKSGTNSTRTDLFSGKLTFRADPSHTIAVSVFGDPSHTDGKLAGSGPGPDSAVLGTTETGGTDLAAKWDGLFGEHFIVQAVAGVHTENNRTSNDFADSLAIRQCRLGRCQSIPGSGPLSLSDETYRRGAYGLSGTAFLGRHEVKAGLLYERLDSSRSVRPGGGEGIQQNLDDATGAFEDAVHGYYAAIPLNCVARTDGTRGNFGVVDPTTCAGWQPSPSGASHSSRATTLGVFMQDSWRVTGALTINAGVRYEEQRMLDAAGAAAIKLTGEWSPRLGAVWDPLGNGRSRVFASFGRYYQAIPHDIQVRYLGNEIPVFAFNYTPDRPDNISADGNVAFAVGGDYVSPGLKGMYQDEIVGGVEWEFLRNWSVGVKGIYRALGRAIEDRCDVHDSNVSIEGLVPTSSPCAIMNPGTGDLGQIPDSTNPRCFADFPKNTQPAPCDSVQARRYFRGLQFDVRHRFADRFTLLASYLYSRLEGNYDGLVDETTGAIDTPNANFSFDNADVVPNGFGRLALDRTHQLKLSGTYVFPFGLQAGVNAYLFSGRPLSIRGYARDDPYNNLRYLLPRGSYGEMPGTYGIDLHLQNALALGPVSLIPILDVFNLTNVQRATDRNQVYNQKKKGNQTPPFTNPTNPTFGLDTDWQSPRLVRVGARVSF